MRPRLLKSDLRARRQRSGPPSVSECGNEGAAATRQTQQVRAGTYSQLRFVNAQRLTGTVPARALLLRLLQQAIIRALVVQSEPATLVRGAGCFAHVLACGARSRSGSRSSAGGGGWVRRLKRNPDAY